MIGVGLALCRTDSTSNKNATYYINQTNLDPWLYSSLLLLAAFPFYHVPPNPKIIMKFSTSVWLAMGAVAATSTITSAYVVQPPHTTRPTTTAANSAAGTVMQMSSDDNAPNPMSFREAEILGLRLMQEGKFNDALVGT